MKLNVRRHQVVQPLETSYRLIPLTQGKNAIVDADDFEWLMKFNWCAQWSPQCHTFYACRGLTKKGKSITIILHREIMKCISGEEVDHKNFDGLDNRKENLRKCTGKQNACHKRTLIKTASGYKGVTQNYCHNKKDGRWSASIRINGKQTRIGIFEKVEDAARAYDSAARIHHGEFAHTNFTIA